MKKSKNEYFANLNEKDILDNKLFWKTIQPSLSDKIMTRDGKRESVKTELEAAKVLNKFFSNIVNNLEISKCSKSESFIGSIEDQTLRETLKYKNHLGIIAIQNNFTDRCFLFQRTQKRSHSKRNL